MFRRTGDREGESKTLDNLGVLQTLRGCPADAREPYRQALAIARDLGLRDSEAAILNGLGEAAAGDPSDAIVRHDQALAIAVDIGDLEQQVRAHAGLARAYRARGQDTPAREHEQRAAISYADLGAP